MWRHIVRRWCRTVTNMQGFGLATSWRGSSLHLGRGGLQTSTQICHLILQFRNHCGFSARLSPYALEFNFAPKELISEPVKAARVAAPNAQIPVRTGAPWFHTLHPLRHSRGIRRALDRICHGGKENIRIRLLYVLDSRLDVVQFLTLIPPHQEHSGLNSI